MTELEALLEKWVQEDKKPMTRKELTFLYSLSSKDFAWFMAEYHKRCGCCKDQVKPLIKGVEDEQTT